MSTSVLPQTKSDIADLLVADGLISPEVAAAARQASARPGAQALGVTIAELAGLDREVVYIAGTKASEGVAATYNLRAETHSADASSLITQKRAETLGVVPLRIAGNAVTIAWGPKAYRSSQVRSDLQIALQGYQIDFLLATSKQIDEMRSIVYRNDSEIAELSAEHVGETGSQTGVRIVALHLEQALRDGASDVHFEPDGEKLRVRYRIDGVLAVRTPIRKEVADLVIARVKVMANMKVEEKRVSQDGRITHMVDGTKVNLRITTLPAQFGEEVIIRILDDSGKALAVEELGMSESVLKTWQDAYSNPIGMIIVSGPTGAGKTTTLNSTLLEKASPEVKIITAEDPVEYQIPGISQVQMNRKAGLTFETALDGFMRADPHIILVGEIRNKETASIAIESAQTGHLVMSTLHTNSAPAAVSRLVKMGIEPFLLADTIRCVLAQRLVRALCKACKQPVETDEALLKQVGFTVPAGTDVNLFEAIGCQLCHDGYRGRIAVHEAMAMTDRIAEAICNPNIPPSQITAIACEEGMVPLREDGWLKVAAGLTTINEIRRAVS
ncbi:GspE/PulE family protein [Jonesiaceae bacterium BS-20]|uniref:GspE/PulE family protein n=1 Tax=Jonesiaceae bacterium BS-20 TaxID=3120821 RepID=A0AAU7DZU0_9MICO